jgi:diguanylate cyclase (GGDEF)-like protein
VFDLTGWSTALLKYGAVTQLTVSLYDTDAQCIAGPSPAMPLTVALQQSSYDPGLFSECVHACLAQPPDRRRPYVAAQPSGLAVIGVALRLDDRVIGVVVAGYVLTQFPEPVTISRLARDAHIPFPDLWSLALKLQPMPVRRLVEHGELLQVLGDALLIETTLRRQSVATAEQLAHQATHDALTDLPNRALLADRLVQALSFARRRGERVAVLILDIDRFKNINDSVGHQGGDELLQIVGRSMRGCVRSSDIVGRQSGDEFVIVLSILEHAEDAAAVARKILACVAGPHRIGGQEFAVTLSIGISVFPEDGGDPHVLLAHADMALYHAKTLGRNQFQFFEASLNLRAMERRLIEVGLTAALARNEFELAYQPKVNLETGAIVGAEALLRWRHPERGLVAPDRFVPVAEDTGQIWPIGRWVIREACRQTAAWQTGGLPPIAVAVNMSSVEFRHQGFLENVAETLTQTGLDPRSLEIELTESALMPHNGGASSVLAALKQLGVRLTIDDFGTGWSSLSYLHHFPIDTLKIDQSFVQAITAGSHHAPIVSAVINLGRSLGLRVVAEGIETLAQVAFLQDEHCHEGQGFYFSHPLSAEEFGRVLAGGAMRGSPLPARHERIE